MSIKPTEFTDDLADPNNSLTSVHVSNYVTEEIQFEKRFLLSNVSFLLLVLMVLVIPLMSMVEQ